LSFCSPLRLRSLGAHGGRKVTWLELFFDLIFVAAVSQVAVPLREHYSVIELLRLAPLFVLIWWAWTGHTVFSTRFDTDDAIQRGLTLVQMFAVAVMAANAKDALDSRSSAGFAAAYAAVRLVLVAQYFRARHVSEARPLTTRYLVGHGGAALLWLVSAFVPAPGRFWVWGVAFAIDLGTPWLAVPHSVKIPPDAAHLPERFGLFTLILIGESIVAVMQGMESQENWSPAAACAAFLGMGISFVIWWWYFDGVSGASEQPVRTRREAIRFQVWSYAHCPLSLGIVIAGVGIEHVVTAASRAAIPAANAMILTGAVTTVMVAMTVIDVTSTARRRNRSRHVAQNLALAGTTLALGIVGHIESAVVLIVAIAALCVAQLVLSLRRISPSHRQREPTRLSHPAGSRPDGPRQPLEARNA
jgi:low temperature requirement protein LtrA